MRRLEPGSPVMRGSLVSTVHEDRITAEVRNCFVTFLLRLSVFFSLKIVSCGRHDRYFWRLNWAGETRYTCISIN